MIRWPGPTSPAGVSTLSMNNVWLVEAVTVTVLVLVMPLASVMAAVLTMRVPLTSGAPLIWTTRVTMPVDPGAMLPRVQDTTLPAALPVLAHPVPPAHDT